MKSWWKSKTLWFNALVTLAATVEASTGMFKPYLNAESYLILVVSIPVVNGMLRFITTQGVSK